MRLIDLPGTTSFRLALRFLLLFGAASLALFGFLYIETDRYILHRIDDWLIREEAIFDAMDRDTLTPRLMAHVEFDPSLERPVALFDLQGQRIAGTPLPVSAQMLDGMPQDRIFEFRLRSSGHVLVFRGLVHRRASGSRLVVARDMAGPRGFTQVLINAFISGAVVTALLGLAGAAMVGADTVRRIAGVTDATQRIVNGDLSERLPTGGRADDLDRLIVVINGMLAELERLMQEVKGVCDNIAHDLRTPLTRLLAGLERARRRAASAADYAAAIDEAILETQGILETFAAILRISEAESGARRAGFTELDLSAVVADAVELYEPMAEAKGVRLLLASHSTPARMRGDTNLLFEAVGNLVDNAVKFTPRGGCVTVCCFSRNGTVGFDVTDTGPGIPKQEREAVLRRFYRGEASRNISGSGLGLALVSAVARLHGMDMAIADASPGCRITLSHRVIATGVAVAAITEGIRQPHPGTAPATTEPS